MKHCLQCGTVATNSETKCENCGFTKFTAPTSQTWGDMQIKINAQADRIAELEAALKKTVWQINYVAGRGYVGGIKRDDAEKRALEVAREAARLLDGDK